MLILLGIEIMERGKSIVFALLKKMASATLKSTMVHVYIKTDKKINIKNQKYRISNRLPQWLSIRLSLLKETLPMKNY